MRAVRPSGHADIVARLWRAAREQRLAHALLLEGPPGIGKHEAAKWFALGCLCERGPLSSRAGSGSPVAEEPCGTCGPCKRVLSGDVRGNHPDLFVLDPFDPLLAKDFERGGQIRVGHVAYRPNEQLVDPEWCVERFLDLCVMEGRARAVLIREAHRMNVAAQNALLKTLEEPRPGTFLVLETHKSSALLPTVKSRCIRIRFEPLAPADCERILRESGLEAEAARQLARTSRGAPGLALAQERMLYRKLRDVLVAVASGERPPLDAAQEVWALPGEFAGSTPGALERERARVVAELALALLQDALRAHVGVPAERLAHGTAAAGLSASLGERELRRRIAALLTARSDVEHNLGPASILERVLLLLADGPASAAGRVPR